MKAPAFVFKDAQKRMKKDLEELEKLLGFPAPLDTTCYIPYAIDLCALADTISQRLGIDFYGPSCDQSLQDVITNNYGARAAQIVERNNTFTLKSIELLDVFIERCEAIKTFTRLRTSGKIPVKSDFPDATKVNDAVKALKDLLS